MATLISIATRVLRRLSLVQTSEVVASTDPTIQQILEMLQEDGDELARRHEWSKLHAAWSFVVSSDPHTATYPTDFDRLKTKASFWRSDYDLTPLIGPELPDEWHLRNTAAGTNPGYWRRIASGIQFLGITSGVTVSGEYISNEWILDTDGVTGKAEWEADSDTPKLDSQLLILGGVWRWKQIKGLDYAEDMATYERELARRIMADTSAGTIYSTIRTDMTGRKHAWPGTVTEP